MSAAERVRYAEGCFGHLLLREDPGVPVLQFGLGGRPPTMPSGLGLGVEMRREVIERWTSREASVV